MDLWGVSNSRKISLRDSVFLNSFVINIHHTIIIYLIKYSLWTCVVGFHSSQPGEIDHYYQKVNNETNTDFILDVWENIYKYENNLYMAVGEHIYEGK